MDRDSDDLNLILDHLSFPKFETISLDIKVPSYFQNFPRYQKTITFSSNILMCFAEMTSSDVTVAIKKYNKKWLWLTSSRLVPL